MVKIEDEERNRNSKKFYQMINKRKINNEITVNNIKNKAGQVTENEEQTKTAWTEHFKELLTETSINETELVKTTENENNISIDDEEIGRPTKEDG
ncbi:hypothetical protein QE152_g4809 [Popillia japonica]|uniref:Uncharacterized protein n=1 Tax=Popillia japonica TaxID=7064 RepID=A0AAW1MYW1_POPJA